MIKIIIISLQNLRKAGILCLIKIMPKSIFSQAKSYQKNMEYLLDSNYC